MQSETRSSDPRRDVEGPRGREDQREGVVFYGSQNAAAGGAKRCVGVRFRLVSKTRQVPSADAVATKAPVLSTSISFTGALWHWRAASPLSVRSSSFQVRA